ncbi:uncharacterized protein [Panulirus ornatus]
MANGEQHTSSSSSRRTTPPRQTPPRTYGSGTPSGATTPRHMLPKKPLPVFNSYMSLFQVQEKLKKGEVIEGVLRINPKNYEDAYISAPDGGMDIYIGGVLDRNAALHRDVVAVEIKPLDQWKVLYDLLDEYLESHQEERNIVYRSLKSNVTASVANTAALYNPLSINTNVRQSDKWKRNERTNPENIEIEGHLEQCESDVVIEEELESQEIQAGTANVKGKKKRRGGRGKKKRRRKLNAEQIDAETCDSNELLSNDLTVSQNPEDIGIDDNTLDIVIALQDQPVEVADEILILPSPQDHSNLLECDSDVEDKAEVVVVPPDQLSECEFTDDESGRSEILDYDRAREDQSFIQAQWEAFQNEQAQEQQKKQSERQQGASAVGTQGIVAVSGETVKNEQWISDFGTCSDNEKKISDIGLIEGFIKEEITNTDIDNDIDNVQGKRILSANAVNSVIKDDQNAHAMESDYVNISTELVQGDGTNLDSKKNNLWTSEAVVDQKTGSIEKSVVIGMEHMRLNSDDGDKTLIECDQVACSRSSINCKSKKGKSTVLEQLLSSLPEASSRAESSSALVKETCTPVGLYGIEGNRGEDKDKDCPEQKYLEKTHCGSPGNMNTQLTEAEQHTRKKETAKIFGRFHDVKGERKVNEQEDMGNLEVKDLPKHTTRKTVEKGDRKEPTVLQVKRLGNWEKFVQRTAHIVYILERKHTRMGAGTLKLFGDKNPNFAFFMPSDHRLPRMKVPMRQCPPDFMVRHQDYLQRIYLCKIVQWREPKFALGELVRDVGAVGDVEAETEAMLLEHGIDYAEFPDTVLQDLPSLPWSIPLEEIKARTDLRDECIFTIDPSTARDLDDAVSCLPLPSGNYRVGVHIADVSYFVTEGSPLDDIASNRATSVYLTQKVISMLPRVLCESLCSLNPGEDRLAFSVIWELRPDGEIIGEWFGRTVIRSCVKLAYEHAQSMIENPEKVMSKEEIPEITGPYTSRHISRVVNDLHSIAVKLRKKRFQDGALRLDQVKIAFCLDWETKAPQSFYVCEQNDSNRLIEEFMLLANMAAAHKIYNSFPEIAVLRRHPPPLENPMEAAAHTLAAVGVFLNISNAGALNNSIAKYIGKDKYSTGRLQVITSICSKPMQLARYFCSGFLENESLFRHYALNVPLYTHFTSPIRRYADVMVHRLLAAAVDQVRYKPPALDKMTIQKIAEHCNDRKLSSKILQELSSELYLSVFIRQVEELVLEGMVIMVLDHSFDVLLLNLGVIKRVYTDKLPLDDIEHRKGSGVSSLILKWKTEGSINSTEQHITLFTLVTVSLRPAENDVLKFHAVLLRPS